MKTLSKLSKFLGCYAEWQQLREDFGLVWTDDDVATFRRMTEGDNIEDMMAWVNKASKAAPDYAGVLHYACLTGLRAAAIVEAKPLAMACHEWHRKHRIPDIEVRKVATSKKLKANR